MPKGQGWSARAASVGYPQNPKNEFFASVSVMHPVVSSMPGRACSREVDGCWSANGVTIGTITCFATPCSDACTVVDRGGVFISLLIGCCTKTRPENHLQALGLAVIHRSSEAWRLLAVCFQRILAAERACGLPRAVHDREFTSCSFPHKSIADRHVSRLVVWIGYSR